MNKLNKLQMLLLCLPLLLGAAIGQQSTLDGRGWRSLSNEARVEFVAGYVDCYAGEVGNWKTFTESWYAYAPRISRYYDQHPDMLSRPATGVLYEVRSKNPPKPLKGGETWTGKHAIFDGLYWRQMEDPERAAFINGYLSCYLEQLPSRPLRFSKPPAAYADRVSQWFEDEPAKSSAMKAKREQIAIADVLHKFTDQQLAKK